MNSLSSVTVALWGFGKTGQSLLSSIGKEPKAITIFEPAALTEEQRTLAEHYHATIIARNPTKKDLEAIDYLLPSPGVNTASLESNHKIISELDLFARACHTPTIAVTGSAGKTTTVTLLAQLLTKAGKRASAIGNIGTPLLDIIPTQDQYDFLVLELSSFQLEQSHFFAPTFGLITNLFANHLDRHGSLEAYAEAKAHLFMHQPATALTFIPKLFKNVFEPYIKGHTIVFLDTSKYKEAITPTMQRITFTENWIGILALLEHVGIAPEAVNELTSELRIPEHRCEFLGIKKGIAFYNDSKSTIAEATLATVTALNNQSKSPLILLLGGISKGVNREPLIASLPNTLKEIICFGKEAEQLDAWCRTHGKKSSSFTTLEAAWEKALTIGTAGDTILLSPAGASYDLFAHYEERGNRFKELVSSW